MTSEELAFLTLHAQYGPIISSAKAAALLGFGSEGEFAQAAARGEIAIDVFRPAGRGKVRIVGTMPLAKLMIAQGLEIPRGSIPEPWSFSDDDTAGPEVLVLGQPLSPAQIRAMTLEELTALRMHARYGPIITSAKAAELLLYPSSGVLARAVRRQALPLKLVVPDGRQKGFLSTRAVAGYLSGLAVAIELRDRAGRATSKPEQQLRKNIVANLEPNRDRE